MSEYVVRQSRSEGLLVGQGFDNPLAPLVTGLEPRAERVLRGRCLMVLACLERIAAVYHSDPELREFPDVPCPLREWVLADARVTARRIDYCRFDVIGDYLLGLRVLEFNGEYPLGLLITGLLARYWRRAPVVGELIAGWDTAESLIEGDTWLIDELLALGAAQGVGGERVALLCAAQFQALPEIVLLAAQARRRGLVPVIMESQELVAEPGVRLAFLVYPTFALLAGVAGYPALAERMLTGELVISNGITGRVVGSNKLALAVMSDPRFQRLFTGAQRDAIAALVPWSRKLGAGMSADEALAQREDLVLKAPYEAQSRAVYIGREHSPARWRELVESAASRGWLVQEFVSSQRVVTQDGAFYRTLGVGIANGHVVGYTVRLSTSLLATSVTGGGVQSVLASPPTRTPLAPPERSRTTYLGHGKPLHKEKAGMRPRLREDVRYLSCPDGVYLHSDRGVCTLKGTTVHAWLTRLQPFLTGDHVLDELTEALPADQRDMVGQLVRTLYEQGFVIDVRADRPHSLTAAECQTYAEEIGFVRYSLDSAEHRFQCYRQARVTMLGSGPVLTALLEACLRSGLRDVRVAGCGPAQVPQLRQVVRRACRDGDQHVEIDHSAPVTGGALAAVIEASDVVLQVCAAEGWAELVTVARECGRAGKIVGQVLVDREETWIAPVGQSRAESGWRRLRGLRLACSEEDASGEDGGADGGQAGWLTGPVPVLVAAQLALGCFRHLTGMDELPRHAGQVSEPVMTRVDLRTLDTRTHSFVAHPLATFAEELTEREIPTVIEAYASGPPVSPGELLDRSETVVDARCGLFGRLNEDELTQLPLWVCRASVSDPCGLLPAWAPAPVVTGHGLDRDDARLRTLLEAFAAYGSLAVDRRRLTGSGAMGDAGRAPGVWGMDLVTGRPRVVLAVAAMPVLDRVAVPYRSPVGAAAGLTWNGAVSAALRQHCELLLAQRLAVIERPLPRLDLTQPRLDPAQWDGDGRAFRLLRLLTAAREPVEVYDLSDLLGVPACAVLAGAVTVALTCGTTMTEAVGIGLERALLAWQARSENQPDYAPPAVLQLGERLRAPAVSYSRSRKDAGITSPLDALRAAGHTPVAVPLDHDPEAIRILPYIVQVVLCRD